jgi:hypothetical protein
MALGQCFEIGDIVKLMPYNDEPGEVVKIQVFNLGGDFDGEIFYYVKILRTNEILAFSDHELTKVE